MNQSKSEMFYNYRSSKNPKNSKKFRKKDFHGSVDMSRLKNSGIDVNIVSEDAFKKTKLGLKHILRRHKISTLTDNFRTKLKRYNTRFSPV